jgi:hypothetical protein
VAERYCLPWTMWQRDWMVQLTPSQSGRYCPCWS